MNPMLLKPGQWEAIHQLDPSAALMLTLVAQVATTPVSPAPRKEIPPYLHRFRRDKPRLALLCPIQTPHALFLLCSSMDVWNRVRPLQSIPGFHQALSNRRCPRPVLELAAPTIHLLKVHSPLLHPWIVSHSIPLIRNPNFVSKLFYMPR